MSSQVSIVYQTWDVWLADVHFEEINQSKKRPVLILNDSTVVVYALKMTSHDVRTGEYPLKRWKEAGLDRPTVVRIGKKLQLSSKDMIRKFGQIHPVDRVEIMKKLKSL